MNWLVIYWSTSSCSEPPHIPSTARVLKIMDSSLARPRNSSDHVKLAVRIADVGVSLQVWCIFSKLYLIICGCFFRDSILSFLIAFGFMCLQNSDVVTRSVIATLGGIILILIIWCIWASWRNQEPSNADKPNKRTTLTFEEDHVKSKEKGFTFMRDDLETKSQPTMRPNRTLLFMKTTLNIPFQKFGEIVRRKW